MRGSMMAIVLVGLHGGCAGDIKGQFLADLKDVAGETVGDTGATDGGPDDTAATDTAATDTTGATDVTDTTGATDATTTTDATGPTDTSVAPDGDATASDVATDIAVSDDVPAASDVVIAPDALEGFGWHAAMTPGLTVGAPIVWAGGVAVPVENGSAIELRAWSHDGDGLFAATLFTGVAPVASGGVACGGVIYVAGHEADHQRAFVARFEPATRALRVATFFPKVDTTGGSVALLAPRCGGPGAYVQLEPIGAVTYRAHGGGTVQLTAEQTQDRSFLVDLAKVFSDIGTLGTVSADKIRMIETAVAEPDDPIGGTFGQEIFYIGEARVTKQLGGTTLQPGDQLVYAHDYTDATGGTATNVAFYGDNDLRGITAAFDGRFAVHWRAQLPEGGGEEQRITAFTADGQQIATAVVPMSAPIARMRWVGDALVLAGTFTGAPPFPGDNVTAGTWLAHMQVGAAMTVTRSAAFGHGAQIVGALHRVALAGDCADVDAWATLALTTSSPSALRVVALGDDGGDCTSARVGVDPTGVDFAVAPLDATGEYAVSTSEGAALTLGGGAPWPAGSPEIYLGRLRARAGSPAVP